MTDIKFTELQYEKLKNFQLSAELPLCSSLNTTINEIESFLSNLGITRSEPQKTNIDYSAFTDITATDPAWIYMYKFDNNVYMSCITDSNYGDYFAFPIQAIMLSNAFDFASLDENKELSIGNYIGDYTYIDTDLSVKISSVTEADDISVLYNVKDSENKTPYRWCSIYSCKRNLVSSDVFGNLDIKYVAQSDKEAKVINTTADKISTMDFSFKSEPFVMSKNLDYIAVLRTEYIDNLSSLNLFDTASMDAITYFRCKQLKLKDEFITNTINLKHGNLWIGFAAAEHWRNTLALSIINDLLHKQPAYSEAEASNAYHYIGPMSFIKDYDNYTVIFKNVLTLNIADSIYANTASYEYVDNKLKNITADLENTALKSVVADNISSNIEYVKQLSVNTTSILDALLNTIINVADPIDDTDAVNKQYIDMKFYEMEESIKKYISNIFSGIIITDNTTIKENMNILSTIIERAN